MLNDVEPLPGYEEPYGLLCAILQDGTNEWRWELDPDLSEDAVVWQPAPGMHSIGAIMLHIIGVEIVWFERFALDIPFDREEANLLMMEKTDVDAWRWPDPPAGRSPGISICTLASVPERWRASKNGQRRIRFGSTTVSHALCGGCWGM